MELSIRLEGNHFPASAKPLVLQSRDCYDVGYFAAGWDLPLCQRKSFLIPIQNHLRSFVPIKTKMITTSVNAPLLGLFQPAELSNRNPIQITDKSDSKFMQHLMMSCSIPFSYLTLPCHLVSKAQIRTWRKPPRSTNHQWLSYIIIGHLQPPQMTFDISAALTAKCLDLTDLSCIHSDKT